MISKSLLETAVSNYTVPLTLPSGLKIRVTELKNRDFFVLVKFCENDDFEGFVGMINRLIPEFSALNIVDKAYVLIAYRALFVHAETHVHNEDSIPIAIPLYTILDKLEQLNASNRIIPIEQFQVCISPFNNYNYEDSGSIFDCIEWIEHCTVKIEKEDVHRVIDALPPKTFSTINKEIIKIFESFSEVEIIAANENFNLNAMHISLVDNSFGKFVMSLYKVSLQTLFENLFIYSQRMGSLDYFNLSPLDSQVLENILQKEAARANEANQTTPQHANPLTPQ
jgi:hypothetical protein